MQARFLLGPAGSGKTFRCLAEIRAALREPEGAPLLLLAPKQATFQLERQLLAAGDIAGFTRLHILSFDRLARFVLERLKVPPPRLLSDEGRVMVLRALLLRHGEELQLFRHSARRPGFAQEFAALLKELQQHQFGPAKLRALAADAKLRPELRGKLHDLALLAERYAAWLAEHELQDADRLLEVAAGALRPSAGDRQPPPFGPAGLWLDGFAEMTPQETGLLTALVPYCEHATLAFCLETGPAAAESWLSIWSAIGGTFQRCRDQIAALPGVTVRTERLAREPGRNRFAPDSALAALEKNWGQPAAVEPPIAGLNSVISVTECANPEAEAMFAAREILKFVRAHPGRDAGRRYRDCAVLVRDLERFHQPVARVFRRYDIPFFLDRRESVTHHPLAELTRNALRTAAFDWRPEDWFAALKAGFAPAAEPEIDRLENAALEFGWHGKQWREPLPDGEAERLREKIIPPFDRLYRGLQSLQPGPDGAQLAGLIRDLWGDLRVEATMEGWMQAGTKSAIHQTVWDQMNAWLDNVALAFPREPLPLRDWLPILDAGLAGLTVGVIPPALDQVLVGAVDRARNPDLKFVVIPGANESVFPAAPATPAILTDGDREELAAQNAALGSSRWHRISRERYLGYIACTRAGERLALAYSKLNAEGKTMSPSPFIAQLQRIFPALETGTFDAAVESTRAEHPVELMPAIVAALEPRAAHPAPALLAIPALGRLAEKLQALREPAEDEQLSAALAEKIYGPVLKSSVSRLEEFASCPFRFFVRSGLRANERKIFELDARERGNFQHDVLREFHESLAREGKRWRDITPAEARDRIRRIAGAQMESHRDGLFRASAETAFAARAMSAALQDFIAVIVGWMHSQYEFDPVAAELGFGGREDAAPAWELALNAGHKLALQGRIDRVDLWREPGGDGALAVVTDYKSGGKKLDALLVENGIQLQLLAYLGALRHWPDPAKTFCAARIVPAGAFYVNLAGKSEAGSSRDEVLGDTEAPRLAYRHSGRFNAGWLDQFDRRGGPGGDQFNFRRTKEGKIHKNSAEALAPEEFEKLTGLVESQLRQIGNRIFTGAAKVDPYRKGGTTPCEYCDYRSVCRLDEWTHEWRELRATTMPASDSPPPEKAAGEAK